VAELVQHFRGQEVPGCLFNLEGNIVLPIFRSVDHGIRPDKPRWSEIDILAKTDSEPWVIEVKTGRTLKMDGLYRVAAVSSALGKTTPWLVFFGELHQNIRQQAKDLGVLLTGIQEWEELKRLVCETCLDKSDE
jgi:predicted RecB family endonuclease